MTATAGATRSRRFSSGDRLEGSLVSPFVRHLLVLVLAAAATYFAANALPAGEQPTAWFVAGAALGVVAALLGRRWLGVLLVVLGAGIGLLLHLNVRLGSQEAMHELSENAVVYGGALAVLVVAYVATVAVLAMVFRQRRVE